MTRMHVIDHAPPSVAWTLMRASLRSGDWVLLTERAIGCEVGVTVRVHTAFLREHAETLALTGEGKGWQMEDFVEAAARFDTLCWHGKTQESAE